MEIDNIIPITEWMADQTIFITGVSGFLGKVLLWKLLKSCSNIKTVYVLLRSKKGKSVKERLNELLSVEIFHEFKKHNPKVLEKVKVIEGDICEIRLGIKDSDWALLENEVDTVFHVAASVRFDDTLQKAIFTNTRSTKYALLLAKGMRNLKSFIHVSTAYTNCRFLHIPEKVILTDFDPEKMITIAEKFDEHELQVLTQLLLKDYPNTYIFTKNLAEDLVFKSRTEIPVVIVRPSIVSSSVKEPKPGWCDNMSSLLALFGAAGKGVYRVYYGPAENLLDFTTVDTCVNAMVAAAWHRNVGYHAKDEKKLVFNVTDERFCIGQLSTRFDELQYICPLRNQLWKAFGVFAKNSFSFHLLTFLLHILPGLLIDTALKISGKNPMLMKIYRKIYVVETNLKPFKFNSFSFDTNNFEMLRKIVRKEERKIFYTETFVRSVEHQYFHDAAIGLRKLLGDPPEVFKKDKDRVYRLYWIDLMTRIILFGLFIWILPIKSTMEWSAHKIYEFQDFVTS